MKLSNHEIVERIDNELADLQRRLATTPIDRPRHLARFAAEVKLIILLRDDTDITDARCGNCGTHLFQPGH